MVGNSCWKKGPSQLRRLRRQWQPTPVLLPGKSHGWRSLAGYSPWGRKELDMIEQLHFHCMLRLTLSRLYYIAEMVPNIYDTVIKISAGML